MFFNKKAEKIDRDIRRKISYKEDDDGKAVIEAKIENSNDIFSKFNYDDGDKLTPDFTDFLWEKSRLVPINKDLRVNLYTNNEIQDTAVEKALKDHFKYEYIETKKEMQHLKQFSLVNLILGVIALAVLLVLSNVLNNYILVTVIDILAWVFVWEAFDAFFLERSHKKRKLLYLQKLYSADVEIVKV